MYFKLPTSIIEIIDIISASGYSCYLVGGCVRDMILSRQPGDYDFVTDRNPAEIIDAATAAGWKVRRQGIPFGVVNVCVKGIDYEISTMRADTYGSDPHRPEKVEFLADLVRDLARRDFTINAMAMDQQGRIIDPFGGREDLKKRLLRCVGNPRDRFLEDPLRILRAARFMATTGFLSEPGITAASTDRAVRGRFALLSLERVRQELEKILLAPLPSLGLRQLVHSGILALTCSAQGTGTRESVPLLPEIVALHGVRQNPRFHAYDVLEHTLSIVDDIPPRIVLRWAALLHDIAKGRPGIRRLNKMGEPADYGHAGAGAKLAATILERLRVPHAQARLIVWLVRNHMILPDMDIGRMNRWAIKRSRDFRDRDAFINAACHLFLLAGADDRARGVGSDPSYIAGVTDSFYRVIARTALYPADLEIRGDYVEQRVGKGPLVGKILQDLLVDVQTGRLANNRGELQAAVEKKAGRLAIARSKQEH